MYSTLTLFCTVIFMTTSFSNSQTLTKYIRGSLANSWNLNFTFFTTDLAGTILYCFDYEINNFLIYLTTPGNMEKNLTIRYNKVMKTISLKLLCGCDPCQDKMMNMYIKSAGDAINLRCNSEGNDRLTKTNTQNRTNYHIPKDMKDEIDKVGENNIYTSIFVNDRVGCLESLYYNDSRITFDETGSKFLTTCPRSCPIGWCNEGKCKALDPNGPMCDCSSTALSGPFCNNSMITYRPGPHNAYYRVNSANEMHLKLTWKNNELDKKYCLLDFVNEYGHVTLSIQENFVMKGSDVIANIVSSQINFIDINVTSDSVTIKVNNKPTLAKPALLGKLRLHIGFTEYKELCENFSGMYYFNYNMSQLRQVEPLTTTTYQTTMRKVATSTEFKIDIKIIILGAGSSLLVTIIVLVIILAIICVRRHRPSANIVDENAYDLGYRKVNIRNGQLLSEDLSHYDALEYDRLQIINSTIQNNALPELPSRNVDA